MPTPQGALTRTLIDLTIGSQKAMRAREKRDREMGLTELIQQFQFDFSGAAGTLWGFASKTLPFEFPFYYAPGQRDPDFDRPHFWYGAEVTPAVAVSATVSGWVLDEDSGAVVGATIAVGVCGAGSTSTVAYEGTAHLTFQGFSALAEDEVDFEDEDFTPE